MSLTITVKDVQCPTCGAEEMHPDGKRLLIRAFKVEIDGRWRSQCLVCAGFYNADLTETGCNGDRNKGWFG